MPQALQPIVGAFVRAPCSVATADRTDLGCVSVVIDEIESPLDWLIRRYGRDDRPLIEVHQLQSGGCARILLVRS